MCLKTGYYVFVINNRAGYIRIKPLVDSTLGKSWILLMLTNQMIYFEDSGDIFFDLLQMNASSGL